MKKNDNALTLLPAEKPPDDEESEEDDRPAADDKEIREPDNELIIDPEYHEAKVVPHSGPRLAFLDEERKISSAD